MSKYDEYITSNETPQTLCKEIDCLKEVIKRQKELITTLEKRLNNKDDFSASDIK